MKPIPSGWNDYESIGKRVRGTKFIAFKVPLKLGACRSSLPEDKWFTPDILLQKQPRLKTIIDLTDTNRYYDPKEFKTKGVTCIKINISGGGHVPPSSKIRQFFDVVDDFMKQYHDDSDALLGVHCTHGLNRTGYCVCKYMVERMKMSPEDAISRFELARGHKIKRQNYLSDIKKLGAKPTSTESNWRSSNEYRSPLGEEYDEEYSSRRQARSHHYNRRGEGGEDRRRYSNARSGGSRHSSGHRAGTSSSSNWRERP